jgi:hypothetical protein
MVANKINEQGTISTAVKVNIWCPLKETSKFFPILRHWILVFLQLVNKKFKKESADTVLKEYLSIYTNFDPCYFSETFPLKIIGEMQREGFLYETKLDSFPKLSSKKK